MTPLHCAAVHNSTDVGIMLVLAGGNINATDTVFVRGIIFEFYYYDNQLFLTLLHFLLL